ncbi:hypothetical protein FHS21_001246 [Phyllobacterium trifolii]|jgi:hypothetical protein|uniref:Uncharacterized protein n=1 Tax=Phyllobacterium trifolii TaxID=300193 RepID=A0A839U493_9HYPH|nr:hypothetical protein [Phyllobacterium trifolii]MBB3144845.1 hypothetical protein [Phyllobacterium trifolii]
MDQTTTNLKLPYIAPSQAQKHVTHNEAIRALDALVQLSVMRPQTEKCPAGAFGRRPLHRRVRGRRAMGGQDGPDRCVAG